jgi:hypothetical protein
MSAEDDILEELLGAQRVFTRTFNFGFDPNERPPPGARVRRTPEGVSFEWSWSFGTGGGRTREREMGSSGGESGRRYSPPPPPVHPSRRDALKGETEAEKKKRLEREAKERAEEERLREMRELRMAELRRERERERERQREEQRLREEADRVAERAREEYIRQFKAASASTPRETFVSRERGRAPESKSVRKNQARVEEDYETPGIRRGTGPVKDARRTDLPRRPVPQRQDSARSSATARRGEPPRREALPPLQPREVSKRDKIAAWAAELDPDEDYRRHRYSRASSPSSELVRSRKSKDYGYAATGRARSVIDTSSESSIERRRPSGARSPTRHRHRRSRYYSDSDSYDSEDSGNSARYSRTARPRDGDRYKSRDSHGHRHESRSHGHGHHHTSKGKEEKKKGGIGSFIGKVAKSILVGPEESDSELSEYSSVSTAKRQSKRKEEKVGDRRERERERPREKVRERERY